MAIRSDVGLSLYDAFSPADLATWAGTPLVIRETAGLFRVLSLMGRALPFAGVSLPLKRRGRTRYHQGTARATQHVMGVEQGETVLEGRWVSQHLVEDVPAGALWNFLPVLSAEDLREKVYDLIRDGQELEVTWAGVRRTSSIVEFDPKHKTRGDIEWSLRFEWNGEGAFIALPVYSPIESAASNLFDIASKALDWIKYPANVALDLADYVDTQVTQINGLVTDLRDTLNLYTTGASRLGEIAGRARSIADTVRRSALDVRDRVTGLYAVSETAGQGDFSGDPAGLAGQARLDAWLRDTGRGAFRVAAAAGKAVTIYRRAEDPRIQGVVVVQGDTDLRMIAQQQGLGADGWTQIADFNGRAGSSVTAGDIILIPARVAA